MDQSHEQLSLSIGSGASRVCALVERLQYLHAFNSRRFEISIMRIVRSGFWHVLASADIRNVCWLWLA